MNRRRRRIQTSSTTPSRKSKARLSKLYNIFSKLGKVLGLCMGITLVLIILIVLYFMLSTSDYKTQAMRVAFIQTDTTNSLTNVWVAHMLPDSPVMSVISIPPDVYVSAANKYGIYTLAALYELSQIDTGGEQLLVDTLEDLFAVRLDAAYVTQDTVDSVDPEYFAKIARNNFFSNILEGTLYSNNMRILRRMSTQSNSGFEKYHLQDLYVTRTREEVDGREVEVVDTSSFDRFVEKAITVADTQLAEIDVYIINTTGKAGLATNWARFFTHAGFSVIAVDSSPTQLSTSQLLISPELTKNEQGSEVLGVLQRVVDQQIMISEQDTTEFRAEVVLKIGSDLIK